jgi:hypothetical protein
MKQYRITSETFNLSGNDPAVPDNYVDPAALANLKKLAGIDTLSIMETQGEQSQDLSPLSGSIGTKNAEYMRKNNIRPGDAEWFKLWFSREPMTGENPRPKK